MTNNDIHTPVIVFTQFVKHGEPGKEIDLPTLSASLREEFADLFHGVIFYDSANDRWREELVRLVNRIRADQGKPR
jgi:hypothetical protein